MKLTRRPGQKSAADYLHEHRERDALTREIIRKAEEMDSPRKSLDAPHMYARDLGPCCGCGTTVAVVNVMMLDLRGPMPGKGWGCVVCDLPADGAIAVLCNECVGKPIVSVCDGYPKDGKRVRLDSYPNEPFAHDKAKHEFDALAGEEVRGLA